MSKAPLAPQHVEPEDLPPSPPVANPLAGGLNVMVSIPETLEIRMVEASALDEYELWVLVSSLFSSAAIGFLVAYFQEDEQKTSLMVNAILFGVLFCVTLAKALHTRHRLRAKSRSINLRATEAIATPQSSRAR